MTPRTVALLSIILLCAAAAPAQIGNDSGTRSEAERLLLLESRLDEVRRVLKIPGMSAAVVRDQQLIWAQGFGFADVEGEVPATADTPYGLASVTKPVAAVLLMQLVEEGLVDLDAPVSNYGVTMDNPSITSRHLLTHSSHDAPGTSHVYDGNRYSNLAGVMEGAAGKSFAELLSERVLLPLDMKQTALNPIARWAAASSSDRQDFIRLLGSGEAFAHYPSVYRDLARPYQLDENYEVIPGMYHLYHNPGAGLISSVADMAKFDIGLDNGLLVNDGGMREMFAQAFQTLPPRDDLGYGLGWYVQQDQGLDLYWHTGRWPPSTSALYLKVPERNLTFIVLASTDNLTVPFHGIGNGDVTTSALALTFFRYFVYPDHLGVELPEIDWAARQSELVSQIESLNVIVYGSSDREALARELLERELLAYRQAYASAGSDDDARRLTGVDLAAFPDSSMRGDPLRAKLAGQRSVIPPAISARSYVGIGWGIAIWYGLVAASLVWVLVALGVSHRRWPQWLFWAAATWFFGPVAVLLFHLVSGKSEATSQWQTPLGATVFAVTAYAASWILASYLLTRVSAEPHPLMILGTFFLTPLLVALLVFRLPAWVSQRGQSFGRWFGPTLLTELILLCAGFGILFFLTMIANERILTTLPSVSSPFFLALMSAEAIVASVLLYPLVFWLTRRGYAGWPFSPAASGGAAAPRRAWQPLIVSLVVMVVLVAIAVMLMG